MSELKIIVADNYKQFGEKINNHINEMRKTNINYLIDTEFVRFNNGEGKVRINESVRGKDLYIVSDVSNYDSSYIAYGRCHYMSPDEHFQDIKRVLSAECGHASKRTVVMPYLYSSRQDKKDSRESLDCAVALQELSNLGVNEIVTCDIHNKAIMNAVPNMAFENVYLTDIILTDLIENEHIESNEDIICISPDEGAMKRARYFSELLGNSEVGSFYKQRDYSKVVDGKCQIIEHKFLGPTDLTGKDAIVVDDMIASGGSILDTAKLLKSLGARNVYLVVTFALFTTGIEQFEEYYKKGLFTRVYATNASYVPESIKNKEWFHQVDCSKRIAHIISEINYGNSIGKLITGKEESAVKIRKRIRG